MWTTLLIALAVAAVALLAWFLPRMVVPYGRFVREHYRDDPTPLGQCARSRCTRAATTASGYCSSRHEMDDEYNAAGY